jgi:glucokinase
MLLAGDVGATNTRLGVFGRAVPRPALDTTRTYPTSAFPSLVDMLQQFLRDTGHAVAAVEGAAFGVAGPVIDNAVALTNADWDFDGDSVARALGLRHVQLVNDLQAMAWGVTVLEPGETVTLQAGSPDPKGNAALIAPGTGLGEALLHRLDGRLVPSPSEGGHADLAPRTPREIALAQFVIGRAGRASYEHVLSGPGLVNVFAFTHRETSPCGDREETVTSAAVTARALDRSCPACAEALDLFVGLLGAESGNLALRSLATAGTYVGGGIPPKILPALQTGRFMEAFLAKHPAEALVARIPVRIIVHPDPGLLGAAVVAASTATV